MSTAKGEHFNTSNPLNKGGQSPDRQQLIKEPSLKYYPFLLFNVSSVIRDPNIYLARVYWRYNRVSVCFS